MAAAIARLCRRAAAFALAAGLGAIPLATANDAAPRAEMVVAPNAIPDDARPRLFLGGSIGMGTAPDWQAELAAALADLPVILLNPRRPDWNPDWRPEADEPEFRRQVEWELAALERADIIVMYFVPDTQAPISLLEMGLHARSGKMIVLAPAGFWRKGNVDITAAFYGVRQVDSFEALVEAARAAVKEHPTKN